VPERQWAQMTNQELARELRLLPHNGFTSRLIKALDELQTAENLLTIVRQRLAPTG
jgi:hypothetical protein